jgi:hypothetical protein
MLYPGRLWQAVWCLASLSYACILPLSHIGSGSGYGYGSGYGDRLARDINSSCGPNDTAPPNRSTNFLHCLFFMTKRLLEENK